MKMLLSNLLDGFPPAFAIWCNDRTKELLKYGMTATPEKLEEIILNPDLVIGLAKKLKEEREARMKLEEENKILKPKARLMEKVMDSDELVDIGQAAKLLQLPFGRNTLFQELRDRGSSSPVEMNRNRNTWIEVTSS